MNKISKTEGVALLTLGLILIGFGLNGMGLTGSEVSRLFAGASADRSIWCVPSGIGSTVVGILTIFKSPGRL